MVLGSELGSISSEKAKKNLAKKKRGRLSDLLRNYDPIYRPPDVCPFVLPISWSPDTFLWNLFKSAPDLIFWLSWWLGLFLVRGRISLLPPMSFVTFLHPPRTGPLPICAVWRLFRPDVGLLLNLKFLSNLKLEKKRSKTRTEYTLFSLGFLSFW